jgi:SnoaL-like domain
MTNLEIRAAITDALHSYCRGIDRLHAPSIAAAFHPGAALIDYGPEPSTIEAFVDRALDSLGRKFIATQHRVTNISIEIDGNRALVEAYVLAHHVEQTDGGRKLHTFNGRYIDRFEERGGSWKIASRTLRNDWSKVEPIDTPMSGAWVASGRAGSPDPIFA